MEKRGVIFSEYYPGCRTTGACFPIRNRIIAGLSCALIVCEAGARSGALITARDAVMQGKPVFAIPGPAGSATNVGTNEMLKKGARMAARPYDVLSSLELAYPDKIHIRGDAFTMGESEPPKAPVTAPRTVKAAEAKPAKEQTPQRKQQKKPLVGQTLDDLTETERRVMNAIDTDGTVKNFAMNDKCAAGTGRFFEAMARSFEMSLSDFSKLSLKAKNVIPISAQCTVFAESEVISLVGEGKPTDEIAAGIEMSVAKRCFVMAKKAGATDSITLTGGCAKNDGLKQAIEQVLKIKVIDLKTDPQLMGALGAAEYARQKGLAKA